MYIALDPYYQWFVLFVSNFGHLLVKYFFCIPTRLNGHLLFGIAALFIFYNVSLPMTCVKEFLKTSCINYSMRKHPRLNLFKEVSLAHDFGAGSGEGILAVSFMPGACISVRGARECSRWGALGILEHFSPELTRIP